MKIIHCADLHLDSQMNTNLTREQAKERRKEILRTFTKMVDYAKQTEVAVILIAGDLYDTRNVSVTARNVVLDAITSHPEIDFLYLKGNHDSDNFISKMSEVPKNLKLFGEQWTSYEYGDVVITGLELNAENKSYAYNSLALDRDKYNIVTLHGQLRDFKGGEDAEIISLNDLKNKNIDYLALGHVHEYKKDRLDARGSYCYSGCLEGRGFDECGEKGFVLIDIDEDTLLARMKFIPVAKRTLYRIPVDVTGVMTSQEAAHRIEQTLVEQGISSGSLVQIELVGQVNVESEINVEFLQEMFCDAFYFEKMKDKTQLEMNYKDYE